MEVFLQALVNGILLGGFYSLMGMGQNIIFGVMNIVNFCHGEMLMVGMYITYVLYTYFGVDPYVALPIVAVLMFGLGSIPGAFFAGIFLGLLEQMSALFISPSYSCVAVQGCHREGWLHRRRSDPRCSGRPVHRRCIRGRPQDRPAVLQDRVRSRVRDRRRKALP